MEYKIYNVLIADDEPAVHEGLSIIKTIADTFYINPAYLGQLFKNSLNETFSNYVNRKRIFEAKRLLLEEGLSVNEIIEKVGYKDNDYFYKQFRRYEGISFAEYRECKHFLTCP